MRQPNLLIIGAQKCGTTWLHHILNRSQHLYGSQPKELNYWNVPNRPSFEDYCRNFDDATGTETYFYESTPHYFRLPRPDQNVATIIREHLGDIPLILMLRNPVERYLSAATHQMMKGRIDWAEEITSIDDKFGMLSFGYYRQIYDTYAQEFSKIHTFLFDDVVTDKAGLVGAVMARLDLENDIDPDQLGVVLNSKVRKHRRMKPKGEDLPLPRLSPAVSQQLRDLYQADILGMQEIIQRDLTHWLAD